MNFKKFLINNSHSKNDEREMNSNQIKSLKLFLIKPSKYDEMGYPIRFFRGVFISNTIVCINSLTQNISKSDLLGDIDIDTEIIDESVQKIPISRIIKESRNINKKIVVCLVGVQSNQFPRAADLAISFRQASIDVLIGGFHVSGAQSLHNEDPPEIQKIIDAGVIVIKGEIEEQWVKILSDLIAGRAQRVYNFLDNKPVLFNKPLPLVNKAYLKKFAMSNIHTIDCGRGCPYNCSFCTVINVQGKKMRYRNPATIIDSINTSYHKNGINYYFFTDDNFSKHRYWEEIFDGLIALRKKKGMKIEFIMQVDTLAYKINNFVKKAREAGCNQVFIGFESLNEQNLIDTGKSHNNVHNFTEIISTWHDNTISTHAAYIIGFPHDTYSSVQEDIKRLKNEIKPDLASFFMLCPLPGSMDYLRMLKNNEYMESDLNRYDSFTATTNHPLMSRDEWTMAYQHAWDSFYSFENMKAILNRAHPKIYMNLLKNFIWYRNSAIVEKMHPMVCGFFRLKDRTSRRPEFPIESNFTYFKNRYKETVQTLVDWVSLLKEMEELWLQTRKRVEFEERLISEFQNIKSGFSKNISDLSQIYQTYIKDSYQKSMIFFQRARDEIYQKAKDDIPTQLKNIWEEVHSHRRNISNFNILSTKLIHSRRDLHKFWEQTKNNWENKKIRRIKLDRVAYNLMRDITLSATFIHELKSMRRNNIRKKRISEIF